jgi:hypothetical protein
MNLKAKIVNYVTPEERRKISDIPGGAENEKCAWEVFVNNGTIFIRPSSKH